MKVLEFLRVNMPMATEIHKLETRLWREMRNAGDQVVLVTSPLRGEGKSTTVAYLAAALSLHPGRRILAMDLDFRQPRLNDYYEVTPTAGLAEVLNHECSLEKAITSSGMPTLDLILPAGEELAANGGPDPGLLLNSPDLVEIFGSLRNSYDLILVDVPALLPVPDATVLIPYSDAVLLVVMAGKTTKPHLTRARELCLGMGANIIGMVVGNIQEAAPEYMDAGYQYGSSYGNKNGQRESADKASPTEA